MFLLQKFIASNNFYDVNEVCDEMRLWRIKAHRIETANMQQSFLFEKTVFFLEENMNVYYHINTDVCA